MAKCICCGDDTDGLFPIYGNKADEDYPERTANYNWCGVCWQAPDCEAPYDGVCYRHEYDPVWYMKLDELYG